MPVEAVHDERPVVDAVEHAVERNDRKSMAFAGCHETLVAGRMETSFLGTSIERHDPNRRSFDGLAQ